MKDQDAHQILIKLPEENNLHKRIWKLALDLNAYQFSISRDLKNFEKLGARFLHTLREKNLEDHKSLATFSFKTEKRSVSQDYLYRWQKWVFYDNFKRKKIDKDESSWPTPKAEVHGRKVILCVQWDHYGIFFEILNHNHFEKRFASLR